MQTPKREKQTLNGWVVLDKPADMTSTQAVGKIKHFLRPKKIGHTGTLDPLATGILPLALGEATKAVRFLMDADKEYEFTVTWGAATDTEDTEGRVIATTDHRPSAAEIEAALPAFIGDIEQIPPRYSALKIDGERAYDLARAGVEVEMQARPVSIYEFRLLEMPDDDRARFFVRCGKGTYIRSLARDLGEKLGCYGHISQLRRTRVGPFGEKDAFLLDFIEENRHSADKIRDIILDIRQGLDDIPALALTEEQAARLKQGNTIPHPRAIREAGLNTGDMIRAETPEALVGFCEVQNLSLKPVRLFNL